jgi:hypothetical protein
VTLEALIVSLCRVCMNLAIIFLTLY